MNNNITLQDYTLPLEFPVKSSDGIDINVKLDVVVRLDNFNTFKQKTNLNPSQFDNSRVAAFFSRLDELKKLFESESAGYSVEKLCHDQTVASQITIKVEGPLSQILSENGLQFIRIAALNLAKTEARQQPSTVSVNAAPPPVAGKSSNFWHVPFIATIILLLVVIIVFISSRSGTSATIAKKDKTIAELQSRVDPAKEQVAALQTKMNEARDILNLSLSSVEAKEVSINQSGGQSSEVVTFTAKYAGYIVISGQSTSNNGLINVTNNASNQTFNTPYTFYSDTEQTIPVLPGKVTVEFTNVNILNGATTTLNVVYHY